MEFVEEMECLVLKKDFSGKKKLEPSVQHHVEAADESFNISVQNYIQVKKFTLSFVMPMKDLKISLKTAMTFLAQPGKNYFVILYFPSICQYLIAKLSPGSSFSWAELAI